jgi:hypothetical protein
MDLDVIMAGVAEEFLALAAVLQSNSRHARQLTAASHLATGSESSQRSTRAIGMLQGVLADSAGIAERIEVSTDKMVEILAHVHHVEGPLHRLSRMSALLQIVSILCRIEGGRFVNGVVDIAGLSADIDRLAAEVDQHINAIVDDAATLSGLLQEGVADLKKFGLQERIAARDLIDRTQTLLGPALARAEASEIASRKIEEQYVSFHRATDKVVMSLQSEDLARQRMEHVQEALRSSTTRLAEGESVASTAKILILQRAQLASTRDLLAGSLQSIHSGLQSLGPRIQELVAQTAALAHQAAEDGRSFATLIDSGLGTVADVFRQYSSSANAVLSIVNSVLPSVEKMTGRACALEAIEISIRIISLNAIVKTSHLGNGGAAMGVLAAELHTITEERGDDTTIVLAGLVKINDVLGTITGGQAQAGQSSIISGGSTDLVSSELATLSQGVRVASDQVAKELEEVQRLAQELCAELSTGVELAARAASLSEHFDQLLGSFDRAFEQLGICVDSATSDPASSEDLSRTYSMHSERVLHLQIFAGDSLASSAVESSEFGEDVELF